MAMDEMWDDLEEDAKASGNQRGPICGVKRMMQELGTDHGPLAVESVLRTMANRRLTSTSIHKALESRVPAEDLPSAYCIQRHRSARCSCPKDTS
jgi:hypothetical protein